MNTKLTGTITKTLAIGLSLMLVNCKQDKNVSEGSIEKKPEVKVVSSPFKNTDVKFSTFEVVPNKDLTIMTASGSKIYIGANSLVDKNGNRINEGVTIKYREFMDPAAIMASGIPMQFNHEPGSIKKTFQSAGMFELVGHKKNGEEIFINRENPIKVDLATNNTGEGYSNFFLNQKTGDWVYSGEERKRANDDKINLNKQIAKLKESTAFMGKDYFVFNSMSLLDAYLNDDYSKIYNYTAKNKTIPKRLLQYGIREKDLYSSDYIEFRRNFYPAAMMVWENVNHTEFPKWTKQMSARVKQIKGDLYELTILKSEKDKKKFQTNIKAIMTTKSMLRFDPEQWSKNFEETLKEIQKQEEALAKMTDMYRLLEVNAFGIYNCDRFYSKPEAFTIDAKIILPASKNNFAPTKIFYVSTRDKVSINYEFSDVVKMTICPDSTATLYTVLENDMLAKVGPERLLALNKEKNDNKNVELEFKPFKKVKSVEDLRDCLGLTGK